MKCVQGSFRAERDLIIDLFKPQTLNRVLPAHDPLHDIGNRFADVVICNFAFDNIIIVRIVCPAAAGNDKLQPILRRRTAKGGAALRHPRPIHRR